MKHVVHRLAVVSAAMLGVAGPVTAADSLIYSPYPYLQRANGPWNLVSFAWFHLEDFEGVTRRPGYTPTTGGSVLGPTALTDSVDADDGVIDGSGIGGSSWFSGGTTDTFSFTFDAAVLGALPTHVGIVWTDVGDPKPSGGPVGRSGIFFEAFGPGSSPLGGVGSELGDGAVNGATDEDRFFGVESPAGIASIRITATGSFDWEVDHLQYGLANPIPEPEQWLLMALGLGGVAWRVRSKARLR